MVVIDIAKSVFQLTLCVVAKSVLRLASFLRGFVARLLFTAPLRGCGNYALLRSFFGTPPQAWQVRDRQSEIGHELSKLVGS